MAASSYVLPIIQAELQLHIQLTVDRRAAPDRHGVERQAGMVSEHIGEEFLQLDIPSPHADFNARAADCRVGALVHDGVLGVGDQQLAVLRELVNLADDRRRVTGQGGGKIRRRTALLPSTLRCGQLADVGTQLRVVRSHGDDERVARVKGNENERQSGKKNPPGADILNEKCFYIQFNVPISKFLQSDLSDASDVDLIHCSRK